MQAVWLLSIAHNAHVDGLRREARVTVTDPTELQQAQDALGGDGGHDLGLRLDLQAAFDRGQFRRVAETIARLISPSATLRLVTPPRTSTPIIELAEVFDRDELLGHINRLRFDRSASIPLGAGNRSLLLWFVIA